MIVDKEKTIKFIADFLSDYINSTTLKDFWIKDNVPPNSLFLLKACILAREKCGSDIFVPWEVIGNENPYVAVRLQEPDHKASCLIVSPLCRNEGIIDRSFDKHKHIADVYPLLDLYRTEIIDLVGHDIYNQETTDKEYIDKENIKTGIITSDEPPNKNKNWYKYTRDQKVLIAEMHSREKATRHKDLLSRGAVYPRIRDTRYVR